MSKNASAVINAVTRIAGDGMNNRIIYIKPGRVYHCATCPYRNHESGFCGFCMRKILDEMKDKKSEKEEPGNGV